MNKKLLLVGVLALSPAITFGQNKSAKNSLLDAANQLAAQQLAGNNPAAPATPATPAVAPTDPAAPANPLTAAAPAAGAPVVPDASRVQDGGPLHIQIKRVDLQGNVYFITGELVSNEETDVKLRKTGADWVRDGGATSLGGNTGLICQSVSLGDVPNHDAPFISAVPGTPYKFVMQIVTDDGAPNGLQEVRMALETKEGKTVVHFKGLKPDPANTAAVPDGGTAPDGTTPVAATAGGTTTGTDPNAIAAPGGVPPAGSAASAVGTPGAPGTPAKPAPGSPAVPAAAQLAPAVVASGMSAADKAAQADIKAEAAALTAKHWNIARGDIAALQGIQRNGVKGTRLSPAMATAVNNAINNGLAQIAAAPKKK